MIERGNADLKIVGPL